MESKEDSESFCRSKFDEFMNGFKGTSETCWERGEDPPDYYLYLDGVKFAVEITRLVFKAEVGARKPLPLAIIRDDLKKIVVEAEREAKRANYLHGSYVVRFSKPIENLAGIRPSLKVELLDFIRDTQDLDNAPWQTIFKQGRQKCQIMKQDLNEDKVINGGPSMSKWEGTGLVELCQLLDEKLKKKQHLLRNITNPKILLLHDKYHFIDPISYKECVLSDSLLAYFHTLFVIRGDGDFSVPYSKNRDWLNSPRSI